MEHPIAMKFSAYFLPGPIVLKTHGLSLIYSILLNILVGISWPQQYESVFALGLTQRLWYICSDVFLRPIKVSNASSVLISVIA